MNYKLEGIGEALVFIHGLSDNLLFWEVLAANLKDDYQVLRVDLRGHGETELGSDALTIELLADDLRGLLDELQIENANLVGFSLGGAVALDFAVRYPKRVSSLVLMSTFCKSDEHLAGILNQFKDALENGFGDFYDLILPMVLCPDVIEDNMDELNFLRELALQTANTQAYIQAADACLDFNVEEELSKIDVPTLVLAGKYDEISLRDSQRDMKNRIENAELIVFDDVKHNLLVGKNNMKILNILKKFYKKRK